MEAKKKAAYKLGIIVLAGLAVLTGIEYFLIGATVFLFIIAFIKAWAILYYFMHISNLWSEGGH